MKDKLNGLWVSDLVVPTGFSRVSHGVLKYLTEYHRITGIGVNYKGDPHGFNFPIFPAFLGGDIYGIRRVVDLLNSQDFDYVFMLNDVWVLDKYLTAIKENVKKELPKIYVYFPVDAEYHDKEWYKNFDIVNRAFTYTEFGKSVVKAVDESIKIESIPHGTDLDIFYKKFSNKSDAKINLFQDKLNSLGNPKDLFIVLNANRNQPRKFLSTTVDGFSRFAKDKPSTVKIYMHSGIRDASMDLVKLAERYDIDDRLIITSIAQGVQNVPVEHLNDIYNACDVGINTSAGEGWGLTNTEHAVTEAAQIVPNHSACREIFHDCGLLMDTVIPFTFDNSMVVGQLTNADQVADKLQILYDDRNLLQELGEKAAKKLTGKKYLWSTIAKQWQKIFEDGVNDDSTALPKHNTNEGSDNQ